MMSSSPSPAPIDCGRFELGPPDADGAALAAEGAAALVAGCDGATADGLAPPLVQAARTIPRLAATAKIERVFMPLLLQIPRSRKCAASSRSAERRCRRAPARRLTTLPGSAG